MWSGVQPSLQAVSSQQAFYERTRASFSFGTSYVNDVEAIDVIHLWFVNIIVVLQQGKHTE
jgi:hypothetical protein